MIWIGSSPLGNWVNLKIPDVLSKIECPSFQLVEITQKVGKSGYSWVAENLRACVDTY